MTDPAMTDYAAMQRFAEGDEHQPNAPSVEQVARAIAKKAVANRSHAYVGNSDDLTRVMLGGQFNLIELASAAIAAKREILDTPQKPCQSAIRRQTGDRQ